jgi:hypothetical protein
VSPRPSAPPHLLIREIPADAVLEGFRVVKVGQQDHPDLADSFRSHYEEGCEPRNVEGQHAVLHMGLSFWRDREQAAKLARRCPWIGGYTAHLRLAAGFGFDSLDPSCERNAKHLSVWGDPERFAQFVVDIVPV